MKISTQNISAIALTAVLGLMAPANALAQARPAPDYASMQIRDEDLGGGVHMLFVAGGNMAALVTDQGVVLVDSEYPQVSNQIKAKLASLSDKPLRYLISTHYHWDHVGGNANIATAGVPILISPATLRYVSDTYKSAQKRPGQYTFDPGPLNNVMVTAPRKITMGKETVEILPIKPAHTDGDLIVRFVKADVIVVGDTIVKGFYPLIDITHGGTIDALIAFCDDLYKLSTPKTKIVTGHGPVVDREYVKDFKGMLVTTRARITARIKAGETLEQVVAAKPLADLDAKWEGTTEPFKQADFVKQIYNDLSRAKKP
ncbi:MAG TPA: MBL fold metallo-hydrolase [Phenylobacterium sp.]|nr:MBL fold metallo-hydrolase [Phenylobacterium sp.]